MSARVVRSTTESSKGRNDESSEPAQVDRPRCCSAWCSSWSMLDIAIVNVALPSIQIDLGFSQENLQWVISAYCPRLRRLPAPRRPPRRPARAPARLHGRPRHLHDRVAALRPLVERGLAHRRPRPPGPRRGHDLAGRALDPDDHVPRGPRAQHRPRRLGRGRRRRCRRGRPARRRPRRPPLVAVDLLRQRPGRDHLADRGADPALREPRRARVELRRPRRPARHLRAQHPRARDHEGPRLGLVVRADDRRLRRWPPCCSPASSRRSRVRPTR